MKMTSGIQDAMREHERRGAKGGVSEILTKDKRAKVDLAHFFVYMDIDILWYEQNGHSLLASLPYECTWKKIRVSWLKFHYGLPVYIFDHSFVNNWPVSSIEWYNVFSLLCKYK